MHPGRECLILIGIVAGGWLAYARYGARVRLPRLSGRAVLLGGLGLCATMLLLNLARWSAFSFGVDTAILYQNVSAMARTGSDRSSLSGYENAVLLLGRPPSEWTRYASHLHTHRPLLLFALYRAVFALVGVSPAALLLPHTLLLWLTPVFLYRYWRLRLGGCAPWLTLAFFGNYLFLYPNLADLTEFPFALPLHAAFLWLTAGRRFALALAVSLLALLVHEQLAALYGCLALLLFADGERRFGAVLLLAHGAAFLLGHGGAAWLGIASAYREPFTLAPLLDPAAWGMTAGTLVLLTAPFLFLPLRSKSIIAVLGLLVLYQVAGRSGRYATFHTSYAALLLPMLLYGFTAALARVRHRDGCLLILLLVTAGLGWYKGPLPLAARYLDTRSPLNLAPYRASPHDEARAAAARALAALAPPRPLTVLTGYALLPALVEVTPRLFPLYRADPDFAAGADVLLYDACDPVLAAFSDTDARALRELLTDFAGRPDWETRQAGDQLLALVRRDGPAAALPWPRIDNPAAVIDNHAIMARQVRLLRYDPRCR